MLGNCWLFVTRRFSLLLLLLYPFWPDGTTTPRSQSQTSADKSTEARGLLRQGVEAYKRGAYDEAAKDFERAKDLDPNLVDARLYLATAYADQYIPGAPSQENVRFGEQAIAEFKRVLDLDPTNLPAIDRIGSILFSTGGTPFDPQKLDESKNYHQKHISLRPEDPEPYYWIGVIDWSLAFRANQALREEFNQTSETRLADTEPLPPASAAQFQLDYGPTIEEGIRNLEWAIDRRPDYDDAMAYLNLLYRQKADMEPSDELRTRDMQQADALVDRAMAVKKKKAAPEPEAESERPN